MTPTLRQESNGRTEPAGCHDICVAATVNDDARLAANLLRSKVFQDGMLDLITARSAATMSVAYNQLLDQSVSDYIVFAHQDVYLPPDWYALLNARISEVSALDPNWAVLGSTGISRAGEHVGRVWTTSRNSLVGKELLRPEPAQSVDELAIVLRRASAVRFDENLPNFHFYGTDIVQMALETGKGAYICNLPVVHNDCFHESLGQGFAKSYKYIRSKWTGSLPIESTILEIEKGRPSLSKYRLKAWTSKPSRRAVSGDPRVSPLVYSRQCGWEFE